MSHTPKTPFPKNNQDYQDNFNPEASIKINDCFIITFKPKNPENFGGKTRFSVGAWSLHKYIGDDNALKLLSKMQTLSGDKEVEKYVFKYRVQGTIILYAK